MSTADNTAPKGVAALIQQTAAPNTPAALPAPGVFAEIGALPPGAIVTEEGLARMFGKCTASIKNAVDRGELPRPARFMGKNSWTAGAIVRHHESRLQDEARKYAKLNS